VREDSDIAEDSMMNLKMKIIQWLTRKWDLLIVARCGANGCVFMNADEESEKHLRAILHSAFENNQNQVKHLILGATEDWLKERDVETRNFIEKIK